MHDLKPLTRDAIPRALDKAERYRLLNEPAEAESICLDVLQIDPGNQQAIVLRLLALTDQFADGLSPYKHAAQELLQLVEGEYDRAYYAGVIAEREGKAHLHHSGHGAVGSAVTCFQEAMELYERAE